MTRLWLDSRKILDYSYLTLTRRCATFSHHQLQSMTSSMTSPPGKLGMANCTLDPSNMPFQIRKFTPRCTCIVGITRSLRMTKIPFGFRSNLFMHGFVFTESRFIFTEATVCLKNLSLITQSLNFNISIYINNILLLLLFVMNINGE